MAVVFSMREPSGALTIIVKFPASILGEEFGVQAGKQQHAGPDERQHRHGNDQRFEADAGLQARGS